VLVKASITNKRVIINQEADAAVNANSKQSHEGCAALGKIYIRTNKQPNLARCNGEKKKPPKGVHFGAGRAKFCPVPSL
jgi:hypothetical protein